MVDEQEIKKCKRGERREVTRGLRGQVVTHKFITFPVTWSYFMPKTNRLARRDATNAKCRETTKTNISAASSRFYARGIY